MQQRVVEGVVECPKPKECRKEKKYLAGTVYNVSIFFFVALHCPALDPSTRSLKTRSLGMESSPKLFVERRWHQVFLDESRGYLNRVTRVYKCAAIGLIKQDQL